MGVIEMNESGLAIAIKRFMVLVCSLLHSWFISTYRRELVVRLGYCIDELLELSIVLIEQTGVLAACCLLQV